MKRLLSLFIIPLFLLVAAAMSQAAEEQSPPHPNYDQPGGVWEGSPVAPSPPGQVPVWSTRTGYRKGIHDQSLPEELFASPDAAVLKSGSFAEWPSLLSSFQESSVLVEPDSIAALARTKPYLIIPSGGLGGLASSSFFRAGLAEYARTGGVVLCFAQQKGADLSALPVPEGSKLDVTGAGWTEDSGPLFGASMVQAAHPALTGLRRTTPAVETDGYLVTLPAEATVLLRRRDGFPTLAVYPVGSGWVAVTSLFTERLSGQGLLGEEEWTLVRDLVLWAKAGGRPAVVKPGAQFSLQLALQGAEEKESSAVKVAVVPPGREKPLDERTFPLDVKPLQNAVLPYTYQLPTNIAPGIYHLEHALIDAASPPTSFVESPAGWFAVLPTEPPPADIPRAPQPLPAPDVRITATPRVEQVGDRFRLQLEIGRPGGGTAPAADLLARTAGQEIHLRLQGQRSVASIELPASQEGRPRSYAVYTADGRALVKGTVPASLFKRSGIVPERAWQRPGRTIRVRTAGLGAGSLALNGLGSEREQMLSRDGSIEFPAPPQLPTGVYPLAWTFETTAGKRQEGSVPVMVMGTSLSCAGVALRKEKTRDAETLTAVFSLLATGDVTATVRISFEGPGGNRLPSQETPLAVRAGTQEIAVPVSFKPDQAGIWQLRYAFLASLPDGPGFGREPVTLASGRALVDVGSAAILDIRTDPPLTYAPTSPIHIIAVASGSSDDAVDVLLDGKRIGKAKIGNSGVSSLTVPVSGAPQGSHMVSASLPGKEPKSIREVRFLSGALLPDLVVSIKTSELKSPSLQVGVVITNQGRAASPATDASLYEGDPSAGGKLIRSFPVPPLQPGKQYVASIPWALAGKAGTRNLVAAVDEQGKLMETTRDNNLLALAVEVPEVLLSVTPLKAEYAADEPVVYHAQIANFTTAPLTGLSLQFQTIAPSGQTLGTETIALPDLAPGQDKVIDRMLDLKTPPEGVYLISGRFSAGGKTLADDSRGISVLPTLLLKGSLEATQASTAPCRPLEIRSRAWNGGNVPPTNGTLRLEIRSKGLGQVVYALQLPFVLDARTTRIEKVDFPRGDYTISLRGSAVNPQRGLNGDFVLAERSLAVGDVVTVKRSAAPFPRVLIWAGGAQSTSIEQALIEKMVHEAFAEDEAYVVTVTSADEFTSRALTGMFNAYLLIDINETLGADEALKNGLTKGHGVVVAGSGDRSRMMAESLGFRFEQNPGSGPTSIVVPAGSELGLTGSLPLSGQTLIPSRTGARTLATFADGRPAVMLGTIERGKAMVLPFPLTQSALNAGITTIYSRLIREAVLATLPQSGEPDDPASMTLTYSSSSGPVQARLAETLPPGATMLWSSVKAASKGGKATFEVNAESDPNTILYLFRPGSTGDRTSSTTVFSACGGEFVLQGKVE